MTHQGPEPKPASWWDYRLILTRFEEEDQVAVHEVYYHDDGPQRPPKIVRWSKAPDPVVASSPEEVREILARMSAATARPVLEIRDGKLVEVDR
jgi:hypothetical protein